MELVTGAQLAEIAGKSAPAITKARKLGRLEFYQDTNKYNLNSPKTQKFLVTIGQGQKNIVPSVPQYKNGFDENDEDLKGSVKDLLDAEGKKKVEEAELKKQQRIEKQIKNATRMGELVELEAIEKSIMIFLDRWLAENNREWSAMKEEFKRLHLKIIDGEMSDNEFNKIWKDWFLERAHIAKTRTSEKLREIQNEQGRK